MLVHPYSKLLHVVKEAVYRNPECLYETTSTYSMYRTPLRFALEQGYARSIVKFLVNAGAPVYPTHIEIAKDWPLKRFLLRRLTIFPPWLADLYTKAPAAELRWFRSFMKHRHLFLGLTPELLAKADEAQYIPPVTIKPGLTVPGRQGYLDAYSVYTCAISTVGTDGSHA